VIKLQVKTIHAHVDAFSGKRRAHAKEIEDITPHLVWAWIMDVVRSRECASPPDLGKKKE
jgi:hypothetical protein